jgi:cytoskeletal protein CcmA (bactofilin family)
MNVAGSWHFTWEQINFQSDKTQQLLFKSEAHSRLMDYAYVDIKQNGTAISGTWHGQMDFSITGTINESDQIKFSLTVNNVECEVEGNVSGEKSLFKKEGNSISGIMRFKSLYQTVSTDLTLRESKKSNGQKG